MKKLLLQLILHFLFLAAFCQEKVSVIDVSSFLVNKKGNYYFGYYSKDSKKIEIYQYNGSR